MRKYQVWMKNSSKSDDLDYDYDIVENDYNIELSYSKSIDWSDNCKGEMCASIELGGDYAKIKVGSKKITLDYSELLELKCLLFFENKDYIEILETNAIKILK